MSGVVVEGLCRRWVNQRKKKRPCAVGQLRKNGTRVQCSLSAELQRKKRKRKYILQGGAFIPCRGIFEEKGEDCLHLALLFKFFFFTKAFTMLKLLTFIPSLDSKLPMEFAIKRLLNEAIII